MKILLQQFLGKNHSWSVVGRNIANTLINKGHDVHLFSTNGTSYIPPELRKHLIGYVEENQPQNVFGRLPDSNYDCQISYTALKNFQNYLSRGTKNRFGIWCYEFAGKNSLPTGFAKNYKYCDKLLPPSQFAKRVFLESKIPESAMEVVPHGFDAAKFIDQSRPKYDLGTNKRFKILANIAQPHIRKNLEGIFEAYGNAFTSKDDVCLVLKVVDKPATINFEVSFKDLYNEFGSKFKNHGQVKVISEFVDDIDTVYRSCDALLSLSRSECFHFPSLEALASQNIVIASNWGGQLDFLDNNNSLLVSGTEVLAPARALYWEQKNGTYYFQPNIDDAVEKLRFAYNNTDELKNKFSENSKKVVAEHSWDKIVDKIMALCK